MKNVRFYAFQAIDRLKGGKINKHFEDVLTSFGAGVDTERRVSEILNYASVETTFYRQFGALKLEAFPVINKSTIIERFDDFIADQYKGQLDSLRTMSTSGSTGTPFRIYQNPDKVRRNTADLMYFYSKGGYYIGSRLYYLRIWNELNRKNPLRCAIENMRMVDTSEIGFEGADRFAQQMKADRSEKWILAYASSITSIMNYLEGKDLTDLRVRAIFTGSEALPQPVKEQIIKAFGCPVLSRYSNQENGMLAQQPPDADYFELNEGSYYFEFLKLDSNDPAVEGELARIVITDFYNRALPMIRYDTGDLCVFSHITRNNRRVRVIDRIEGRVVDYLYKKTGERISPHTVTNMMWRHQGVARFQLVQTGYESFTFSVVLRPNGRDPRNEVISDLKDIFGAETTVDYRLVENIAPTAGGKHKYVVCALPDGK